MSMNIKVLKRARVLTKRKYIEDLDRAGYTEEEKAERLEFYDNTISLGIDPVTGLPGRYLMVQNIEHELARLKRHGDYHHFSVALFDLDDLTEVNNEYGHSGGDKFLKRAARVLVDGSRETDYAYKATGGDEFLLVLPRADEESTKIVLDRIRKIGKDRRDLFRSRVLDAKKELKNTDDISKLKYSYRKLFERLNPHGESYSDFKSHIDNLLDISKGLDASAGVRTIRKEEAKDITVSRILDEADKDMYKEKKEKKGSEKNR